MLKQTARCLSFADKHASICCCPSTPFLLNKLPCICMQVWVSGYVRGHYLIDNQRLDDVASVALGHGRLVRIDNMDAIDLTKHRQFGSSCYRNYAHCCSVATHDDVSFFSCAVVMRSLILFASANYFIMHSDSRKFLCLEKGICCHPCRLLDPGVHTSINKHRKNSKSHKRDIRIITVNFIAVRIRQATLTGSGKPKRVESLCLDTPPYRRQAQHLHHQQQEQVHRRVALL